MSTKQQEREALKKIREIVDALGSDSYIATAFEGCFEDAQENIENDWACSMKGRVDDLDQENTRLKEKVKELEDKLTESEKDYEAAHAAAHEIAKEKDAVIASIKANILAADDLTDCIQMARETAFSYRNRMEKAAASVVELADDPASPEFTKAVRDHRNARTDKEYADALVSRLEKIQDSMAACDMC